MKNTPTKIDWDSPVTKKHIKEAKAVGLTLIGVGKSKGIELTVSINAITNKN